MLCNQWSVWVHARLGSNARANGEPGRTWVAMM